MAMGLRVLDIGQEVPSDERDERDLGDGTSTRSFRR